MRKFRIIKREDSDYEKPFYYVEYQSRFLFFKFWVFIHLFVQKEDAISCLEKEVEAYKQGMRAKNNELITERTVYKK